MINNILIDGTYCQYNYYYGLKKIKNSRNEPIGMILGFLNKILQLKQKYPQANIFITFDNANSAQIRKKINKNYKANRPAPPDDMLEMLDVLYKSIKLCGCSIIKNQDQQWEADDILASAAYKLKSSENMLISSDKDFLQLLTLKNLKILNLKHNIIIDANYVIKKYGIPPAKFIELQILIGDKSDNIEQLTSQEKAIKILTKYQDKEKIRQLLNLSESDWNKRDTIFRLNTNLQIELIPNSSIDIDNLKDILLSYELKDIWYKFKNFQTLPTQENLF